MPPRQRGIFHSMVRSSELGLRGCSPYRQQLGAAPGARLCCIHLQQLRKRRRQGHRRRQVQQASARTTQSAPTGRETVATSILPTQRLVRDVVIANHCATSLHSANLPRRCAMAKQERARPLERGPGGRRRKSCSPRLAADHPGQSLVHSAAANPAPASEPVGPRSCHAQSWLA